MLLADLDNQGVKFISMARSFFASCTCDCAIAQGLHVRISGICRQQFMARDNAPKVFIDNKNRMAQRIEQNRVGGLRADTRKRQKLRAQDCGGLFRHLLQRAAVVLI